MIRLCFVCLGNICRSPTAEGIMLDLVKREGLESHIHIDSAGTGAYHEGERADPRSRACATSRGVELPSVARKFMHDDFERFDYVLAMDDDNLANLTAMTESPAHLAKLHLLRTFDPQSSVGANVPDPYYGGESGFDDVFDLCTASCKGLLAHLRSVDSSLP